METSLEVVCVAIKILYGCINEIVTFIHCSEACIVFVIHILQTLTASH